MRYRLHLAFFLLAGCGRCSSPTPAPAPAPDSSILEPQPEAAVASDQFALESTLREARVPGISVTSFNATQDILHASAGLADIEAKTQVNETTVFEAASIAKTIIATCVMQLVAQHRLALDQDVSSLAGFPVRHPHSQTPITLAHLLSHTAALIDTPKTTADGTTPLGPFLSAYLQETTIFLDAGPGETMRYSNVGASLAALIVERVSGEPFRDYAKKHVFTPLQMRHSAFGSAPFTTAANYASPQQDQGSFVRLGPPRHALYPVVDFWSSASDLARFGRGILNNALLDEPTTSTMLRVHFADAAPQDGLGWQHRTIGGTMVVGHEGEDLGASTGFYLDLERRIGVAVLTNGDAFQRGRIKPIADLLDRVLIWSSK